MWMAAECSIAGVTFKNDNGLPEEFRDGFDRQELLAKLWDWIEVAQCRLVECADPDGILLVLAVVGGKPVKKERVIGWIPKKDGTLERLRKTLTDRGQSADHATATIASMGRVDRGTGNIGANVRVFLPSITVSAQG